MIVKFRRPRDFTRTDFLRLSSEPDAKHAWALHVAAALAQAASQPIAAIACGLILTAARVGFLGFEASRAVEYIFCRMN
jgi:hypothetical protein